MKYFRVTYIDIIRMGGLDYIYIVRAGTKKEAQRKLIEMFQKEHDRSYTTWNDFEQDDSYGGFEELTKNDGFIMFEWSVDYQCGD